jgi:hypothetical protein
MKSLTEPHVDRTDEPIPTETNSYAPKRVRWPGMLAVVVLAAAAVGGVMISNRDDGARSSGSPDRSVQAPKTSPQGAQPDAAKTPANEDVRLAQPGRPAQPSQP